MPWVRMKSWKAWRVEPRAQGRLDLGAELAEAGVAVEVGVGLAGGPEGVALDLLVGHGVGHHDVILEDGEGLLAGDLAGLELDVQEGPRGAQQAVLEADQAAFRRLEGLDQPFGIEAPALDVGAVEREEPAPWDTPCSMSEANWSSWPGRASWAVNVQDAASKLKSSNSFIFPEASGTLSGRTNWPISPVLPKSRGGCM